MFAHYFHTQKSIVDFLELERTDCENYFYHRHKSTNTKVKQVTVQNEQSTINALMKWRQKNGETHIEVLLLDEVAAAELQQPSAASDALSFKSLEGID